jgi:predicted component of viral defense system (DUF524 family)
MIELVTLKTKIEQLNKKQQIDVLKILVKHGIYVSENNNGIFFNLSSLNEEQLTHINKYIDYVSDQEETLLEVENVKNELTEAYFNENKKTIKDIPSNTITAHESS